jgi:YidC/Oxa1 family membrane protein insertase
LSLLDFPGADNTATYELVQHSANSVVWRTTVAGQVEVTRTFTINPDEESGEPYLLRHETTFRNLTEQALNTRKLIYSMGTAEPINAKDPGLSLNVGVFDGEDTEFIGRDKFTVGWFGRMIGKDPTPKREIERVTTTVWGSVKNQFFTTIVIPDEAGNGVNAQRVELPIVPGEATARIGVRGRLLKDPLLLGALEAQTQGFNLYTGPKEYRRLVKLGQDEDEVMQFGWAIFAFFSKLLIHMLGAIHNVFAFSNWAWGWAIIATTIIIRTMMWPITAQASKSAKRMAKIQGPMKELQEKYKDNKQKQQEETLKLFREHKINPIGGCLPMFIQLPIFFGLFRMLQSASELRFAEFLWVPDLSAPENLFADVLPIPLNIMPLLMGASMFVQMRMTPTPTTDNASAKMMKIMPFFITAVCYNFSSGLAVYWTASKLFSIFQQWVTNRRKDPVGDAPVAIAGPAANQPRRAKGNPHQQKRKKKK